MTKARDNNSVLYPSENNSGICFQKNVFGEASFIAFSYSSFLPMLSVFWVFSLQLLQIFSELCWTSVYQVWRLVSFTTNTLNWRQQSSYIWGCFSLFRGGFSWLSMTKSHHQPKFHYLLRENSPPYFHLPSPASKNRLLRTGNGERGLQIRWCGWS